MAKAGRPTEYTPEKADEICGLISSDPRMSVKKIVAMDNMPCETTIFKWLREHTEFAQSYTRAKQEQTDLMVEEMLEIADSDNTDTNRSRLQVDTRKWIASKLKPKKYGERSQIELTGEDGGEIKNHVTIEFVKAKEEK